MHIREMNSVECPRESLSSVTMLLLLQRNTMTEKQVVEERVYLAYTFHIAVNHERMSGLELKQIMEQELMQSPWRDVLY